MSNLIQKLLQTTEGSDALAFIYGDQIRRKQEATKVQDFRKAIAAVCKQFGMAIVPEAQVDGYAKVDLVVYSEKSSGFYQPEDRLWASPGFDGMINVHTEIDSNFDSDTRVS